MGTSQLHREQGRRGDTLPADISSLSASAEGGELFYVVATLGNVENVWIGVVGH